jgi:hypothetical protein
MKVGRNGEKGGSREREMTGKSETRQEKRGMRIRGGRY